MAPYSGTAAVLLVVVISVVFGSKPVGNLGDLETGVLAPERNKHQPDEIRITGYGAGYGGWRTIVYSLLFHRRGMSAKPTGVVYRAYTMGEPVSRLMADCGMSWMRPMVASSVDTPDTPSVLAVVDAEVMLDTPTADDDTAATIG